MSLANYTYNGEIDVSELTGTYYLVVNAHGWNTVIDDITLAVGGAYPSQIKYMSKTYADGAGGGGNAGKFDTLWTGDILVDSGSAVQNVALSNPVSDYDFLLLRTYDTNYHIYTTTVIYDIDATYSNVGAKNDEIDMTPMVKKVDDTHITLGYYGHDGQYTHYVGIYGVKVGGGDISSIDFSEMSDQQVSDVIDKLNNGVNTSGTFTTGANQYDKVEVNCGFRPTYVKVILPFSNGDTTAIYDASVSTTTSTWTIPMESRTYTIDLGSVTGETGITDITDTGFKFRCNAANTRNIQCTFEASCGDSYISTVDFTDLTASQVATLKAELGSVDYSTSEQDTGLKWIDGSPVYQKSYEITLPATYDTTNSFIIDNDVSYIDAIIGYEGSCKSTSGYIASSGMPDTTGWCFALHRNPSNQLVLYGNMATLYNGKAYVTVKYTKVSS